MSQAIDELSRVVVREIDAKRSGGDPFIVALDGPSGSGKSSLAKLVVDQTAGAYVPSDDFFAASTPTEGWESRSPAERARDCIEWGRLRREVLEPLRVGRPAAWHPFDFDEGPRSNGTYAMSQEVRRVRPRSTIVLDGAYTSRPELVDLLDLTVLVEAPEQVRRSRLAQREDAGFLAEWHRLWDEAEAYYFTEVRPPSSFDLVLVNG